MIPQSMAEKVEEIYVDGGNDIYGNIAPLWDGEDERFYVDSLSEKEVKQFTKLREMTIMTSNFDKIKEICEPMGIEVM